MKLIRKGESREAIWSIDTLEPITLREFLDKYKEEHGDIAIHSMTCKTDTDGTIDIDFRSSFVYHRDVAMIIHSIKRKAKDAVVSDLEKEIKNHDKISSRYYERNKYAKDRFTDIYYLVNGVSKIDHPIMDMYVSNIRSFTSRCRTKCHINVQISRNKC